MFHPFQLLACRHEWEGNASEPTSSKHLEEELVSKCYIMRMQFLISADLLGLDLWLMLGRLNIAIYIMPITLENRLSTSRRGKVFL